MKGGGYVGSVKGGVERCHNKTIARSIDTVLDAGWFCLRDRIGLQCSMRQKTVLALKSREVQRLMTRTGMTLKRNSIERRMCGTSKCHP